MQYADKVIDHLSKEIETQMTNIMTFRERINLTIYVGPFVLLGSFLIGSKGLPQGITWDRWSIGAACGLGLSYFLMGMVCSKIERHMWLQGNKWRQAILKLSADQPTITDDDIRFDEALRWGYLVVYTSLIVAFVSAVVILSKVQMTTDAT